jgi:hypothetical protein
LGSPAKPVAIRINIFLGLAIPIAKNVAKLRAQILKIFLEKLVEAIFSRQVA